MIYQKSFILEYIPQEYQTKVGDKSIIHNIFRIQDNDSVTCRFYCIDLKKHIAPRRALLDYTSLFPQNDYRKNEEIIHNCFKCKYVSLKFRLKKINLCNQTLNQEV